MEERLGLTPAALSVDQAAALRLCFDSKFARGQLRSVQVVVAVAIYQPASAMFQKSSPATARNFHWNYCCRVCPSGCRATRREQEGPRQAWFSFRSFQLIGGRLEACVPRARCPRSQLQCMSRSPPSKAIACDSTGLITSKLSNTALGEPGRFTMSAPDRIPHTPREIMAIGVFFKV